MMDEYSYSIGDEVTIFINPANPDDAHFYVDASEESDIYMYLIAIGYILLIPFVATIMYVTYMKNYKKYHNAQKQGMQVQQPNQNI